jgi:CRISPR-associated protein Csd1
LDRIVILQGLVNYYNRLEGTGQVAPPGYSEENISFAVVIDKDGIIRDIIDLRDHSGRKPRPRSLSVPISPPDRSGRKWVSAFLWDNSKYALGIGRKKDAIVPTPDQLQEFQRFHLEMLRSATDVQLIALRAFVRNWNIDAYRSLRYATELPESKIVFCLESHTQFIHETEEARDIWNYAINNRGSSITGACLVTGIEGRIARLHPDIAGVTGQRNVGPLTSFNEDAFESFGKLQGANAPVSQQAAHAYATALNTLLSRFKTNRVQIGDATAVFWAEAAGGPESAGPAEKAESLFAMLLEPPTDEEDAAKLQTLFQKVEHGRSLAEIDPGLDESTRFYVLGLSPNAARLSVRFFLRSTLSDLVKHGVAHYLDLSIEPAGWTTTPAAWRVLRETAAQRKADNVSPALAGEVARAILTGGRYPRSLLAQIIMRVRADGEINGLRAAIVRACITRDARLGFETEDVPVALDPSETNPGYRLGRLFAILERAQRMALGDVNANIRHKFFSSASAAPARIFPVLLRGAQDHLGKVRAKGSGGLARWFDDAIADVIAGLPAASPFPKTLLLEDRGRFVVGYYHQRSFRKQAAEDDLAVTTEQE